MTQGMIAKMFESTVYVRIAKNRLRIRHIQQSKEVAVSAMQPFTTQRMLVGNFSSAEKLLKEGMQQLGTGRWFAPAPIMLVHPTEMVEGGLSEIEERALSELAMGAGARKARLWVGHELSDQEVLEKIKGQ